MSLDETIEDLKRLYAQLLAGEAESARIKAELEEVLREAMRAKGEMN